MEEWTNLWNVRWMPFLPWWWNQIVLARAWTYSTCPFECWKKFTLSAKAKVFTSFPRLGNLWSISWRLLMKSHPKILLQLQKSFWSLPLQWHLMAMVNDFSLTFHFSLWYEFISIIHISSVPLVSAVLHLPSYDAVARKLSSKWFFLCFCSDHRTDQRSSGCPSFGWRFESDELRYKRK